jgi:alginate O-acetyltransferase complex protein AlgI
VLFNSHTYLLIFLPVTVAVYLALNRWVRRSHVPKLWLIGASLFFYAYGEPRFVIFLIGLVLFNFAIGAALTGRPQDQALTRRGLLVLGILTNVAFLGYYKYFDFVVMNVNYLFGTTFSHHSIALPLGISFMAFIQIAYIVDCAATTEKRMNLPDVGLFGTFFPYTLSGPIVRYKEVASQVAQATGSINYRNLSLGLYLLSIGLFKKAILADQFAEWASAGFDGRGQFNFLYAWATSLSYTLQIYFDFSGYTDMALGAASMCNIRLPFNFASPYKALNPQDFWRRWHITLGRFLRDYVYIPLGGSRVKNGRVYLNLMITFLVCGAWHGASWTFVIWGLAHGAALVVHSLWKKTGRRFPVVVAWLLTFGFVNGAWVFFRASTVDRALEILSAMGGARGIVLPDGFASVAGFLGGGAVRFAPWKEIMMGSRDACIWIPIGLAICLIFKNSNEMAENFSFRWRSLLVVAAGAYAILSLFKLKGFLYFSF